MKYSTGYDYRCKNCKCILEDSSYLLNNFNPINFGYIIDKCPECGTKYINRDKEEFFTIKKYQFFIKLIHSMLLWSLLFAVLVMPFSMLFSSDLILILVYIMFVILYTLIFKKRWNKAIKLSKKRLNDENYIIDLLITQILTTDNIISFYKEKIITDKTYNNVINKIRPNL